MTFKEKLFSALGDTWCSFKSISVWPWPAVVIDWPKAKLTWDDYRVFTAAIEPGDIIVSREDAFIFSNFAIPGRYKHVAVYTGPVRGRANRKERTIDPDATGDGTMIHKRTIVHAVSEGVLCQDLGELFFNCDAIAAVRAWRTHEERNHIVAAALSEVGKPYDFTFTIANDGKFYCSELAAHCLAMAAMKPPEPRKVKGSVLSFVLPLKRWDKDAYTADGFAESPLMSVVSRIGE